MAVIEVTVSDQVKELAETHAKALGFTSAGDWCKEWLKNTLVVKEQEAHQARANKEFEKAKRRVEDLFEE